MVMCVDASLHAPEEFTAFVRMMSSVAIRIGRWAGAWQVQDGRHGMIPFESGMQTGKDGLGSVARGQASCGRGGVGKVEEAGFSRFRSPERSCR